MRSYDKHLNIFWSYNGRPELEDNLTRAFIVTLSTLPQEEQLRVIEKLVGGKLEKLENGSEIEISYDLQNPYISIDDIKNAPIKYLVGFNPSGKSWDKTVSKIL